MLARKFAAPSPHFFYICTHWSIGTKGLDGIFPFQSIFCNCVKYKLNLVSVLMNELETCMDGQMNARSRNQVRERVTTVL